MKKYYLFLAISSFTFSSAANAQGDNTGTTENDASDRSLMGDIIVTAQKKSVGEKVQDVPIAITALGASQLQALKVRSITDISAIAPNANLDPNGTVRGQANFAIRGSGLNSSVPTLEPGVGLFVDGIYQGVTAGSVSDNFDLANIQILRGPQGTLFGRNVTGGAALIETAKPSGKFGGYVEASLETGLEYSVRGAVEGPVIQDVLSARVAGYYRKDEGWFHNDYDGSKFGGIETIMVRPTFLLTTGALRQTIGVEYGYVTGDSNASQSNLVQKGFDINVNYPGRNDQTWHSVTSQSDIDVGLGDGTITNVFGYRKFKQNTGFDLDARPTTIFHFKSYLNQDQISDELRYAGKFGSLDLTVGGFYMHQNVLYRESRDLTASQVGGGGKQMTDSYGLFGQASLHFAERLEAVAGLRYSYEKKSAQILRLTTALCTDSTQPCPQITATPTINSKKSWDSFSPKLGLNFKASRDLMFYGSFSKAVRSGGYNVRISSPLDPGVYDEEDMASYEVGMKADLFDHKLRMNLSAFYNNYDGLQRTETTFPIVNGQVQNVQIISNSADAIIKGIEAEITARPLKGLELIVGAGYLDAYYDKVRGDLNGDSVVDGKDKALLLSRVAKWSLSTGGIYTLDFGSGSELRGQVFYAYRSRQAAQDNNAFFYPPFNDLRADLTFTLPNKNTSLSVYGRNILNEAHNVASISSLSRVISEGRSIGVEVRHQF